MGIVSEIQTPLAAAPMAASIRAVQLHHPNDFSTLIGKLINLWSSFGWKYANEVKRLLDGVLLLSQNLSLSQTAIVF